MATSVFADHKTSGRRSLSVARLAVAGGLTAAAVLVVCWIGTFVPFSSPTHAYISLFTNAEVSSGRAVIEGTLWSLLFGGLTAAVFGLIYNSTTMLDRK